MITREAIRAIGALPSFSDHDVDVFLSAVVHQVFEAGDALCEQGAPGAACFLILSGEVEVTLRSPSSTRVLATLPPGTIAGQLALVDRGPRTAGLRACSRVETLTFARDDFERLLHAHTPMALRFQLQIAAATARQIREASTRLTAALEARARRPRRARGPAAVAGDDPLHFIQAAATELGVSLDALEELKVVEQPRRPTHQSSSKSSS